MQDTINMVDALFLLPRVVAAKQQIPAINNPRLRVPYFQEPVTVVAIEAELFFDKIRGSVSIEVEVEDGRTAETVEDMAERLLTAINAGWSCKGHRIR